RAANRGRGAAPQRALSSSMPRRIANAGLAATALLAWLFFGIWGVRTALADAALHQLAGLPNVGSEQELALLGRAQRLRPDLGEAWRIAADRDGAAAPMPALAMARHAVRVDAWNWNNWLTLGTLQLQLGQIDAARSSWRKATTLNAGFEAHYAAANFAFLLGDDAGFWLELRRALRQAQAGTAVLALQDAYRLLGDRPRQWLAVLPSTVEVRAAAARFLADHQHLSEASQLWESLSCSAAARPQCGDTALALVQAWQRNADPVPRLLPPPPANAAAQPRAPLPTQMALQIWNDAIKRSDLRAAPARAGNLGDSNLEFPWIGGFAWQPVTGPQRLVPDSDRAN